MTSLLRFAVASAALLVLSAPLAAQDTAQRGVRIGLTYRSGTKPGVVVLPVRGPLGDSIRAMLQRDLDFDDRVTIIGAEGTDAAEVAALQGNATPAWPIWERLGAAAIVRTSVTATGIHIAIYDVAALRVLSVEDFRMPEPALTPAWRMAVHGAADEVARWITGTRGAAQTRVLYVRNRRIHVVDSDGANDRPLTAAGIALSPAWHPTGRYFAYAEMSSRETQVAVRGSDGREVRRISTGSGDLNMTPVFSPDGGTLLFAHGKGEGTDLYSTTALSAGPLRRVSVGRGTDNVSPTYSPDGRRIAFVSGRSGHPEVYIIEADGTGAELLTPFAFGDQLYRASPDWSPDGRQIAFQSQIGGVFQVMTIGLRDRRIRQLTQDGANEDPSWAPDARHVVFASSRSGTRQLFVVDVETGRTRQLTTGAGGARLAAWSPVLAAFAVVGQ